MENKLVKIESVQLENVVKESGLAIQEGEEIKAAYLPFLSRLMEVQDQAVKINFENPTELDEKIAHELRIKTRDIRTDAEKLKDEQKRVDLLRGKVKQDSYNLIASSCKLAEEVFVNVEKAREFAEKKRKEILKFERIEKLTPYDVQVEFYDLANMPEETFTALLDGFKKAYEDRIAAEKKAEEDRIAKEKAEAEEREKQRLENIRLKKEAEEREKQVEIERLKQAKILADQKSKADKEKKELEEKVRKEQMEFEARAAKLKAEQDAKLEAERKERQCLADELKAKQEAEAKETARIESEKKAKAEAEKKALQAPDKDKLLQLAANIALIVFPELRSDEAQKILITVKGYLEKTSEYIRAQTKNL